MSRETGNTGGDARQTSRAASDGGGRFHPASAGGEGLQAIRDQTYGRQAASANRGTQVAENRPAGTASDARRSDEPSEGYQRAKNQDRYRYGNQWDRKDPATTEGTMSGKDIAAELHGDDNFRKDGTLSKDERKDISKAMDARDNEAQMKDLQNQINQGLGNDIYKVKLDRTFGDGQPTSGDERIGVMNMETGKEGDSFSSPRKPLWSND